MIYVILDYMKETIVYSGESEYLAAVFMVPGTVLGIGLEKRTAVRHALENADKAQETHQNRLF